MPGTSLTASGWSHSSGTARCPCYSPEAIPDSVCTTGPQHHHCWTDLLARRPAWVCTYLGSRVSTPPPHRTGWGRGAARPPPARNFTFQPGSSLPDPSPSPSRALSSPRRPSLSHPRATRPPTLSVPAAPLTPVSAASSRAPWARGTGALGGVPARGAERPGGRRPPAEQRPGPRTCRLQRLRRRRRARTSAPCSSGSRGSGGPGSGGDGRAAALGARGAHDLTSWTRSPAAWQRRVEGLLGGRGRGAGGRAGARACGARRGRPGGARGSCGRGPPPRALGRRRCCCCWPCCWAARARSTRATCAAGRGGEFARRDPSPWVHSPPRGPSARGLGGPLSRLSAVPALPRPRF